MAVYSAIIDAAKEKNATFVFCERIKVRRKDIVKA